MRFSNFSANVQEPRRASKYCILKRLLKPKLLQREPRRLSSRERLERSGEYHQSNPRLGVDSSLQRRQLLEEPKGIVTKLPLL